VEVGISRRQLLLLSLLLLLCGGGVVCCGTGIGVCVSVQYW